MRHLSEHGVEVHLWGQGENPTLVVPGGPLLHPSYLGDLGGLSEIRPLAVPALPRVRVAETVPALESVRQHMGMEAMDVIAHSAGAISALCYLAEYPERVRSLTLVAPAVSAVGVAADQEGMDAVLAGRRNEPAMVPAFNAMAKDPDSIDAQRISFGTWGESQAELAQLTLEERGERLQSYYAEPKPEPERLQTAARGFQGPVALVRGEVDVHPTRRQTEKLASLFPNGRTFVIEGSGHYPWIDNPAAFFALMSELHAGSI